MVRRERKRERKGGGETDYSFVPSSLGSRGGGGVEGMDGFCWSFGEGVRGKDLVRRERLNMGVGFGLLEVGKYKV